MILSKLCQKFLSAFTSIDSRKAIIHPSSKLISKELIVNNSGDESKIKIGARSHIHGLLMVWNNCGCIEVGEDVFIGQRTCIYSMMRVFIGNRVQIAHGCNIFDSNVHSLDPLERHKEFVEFTSIGLNALYANEASEVFIDDDVWIGASAILLKGVRIGRGSIVGAGSVVVKSVPSFVVVAGNPARIVKFLK